MEFYDGISINADAFIEVCGLEGDVEGREPSNGASEGFAIFGGEGEGPRQYDIVWGVRENVDYGYI